MLRTQPLCLWIATTENHRPQTTESSWCLLRRVSTVFRLSLLLLSEPQCTGHINGVPTALLWKWQKHRFDWHTGIFVFCKAQGCPTLYGVPCLWLTFHVGVFKVDRLWWVCLSFKVKPSLRHSKYPSDVLKMSAAFIFAFVADWFTTGYGMQDHRVWYEFACFPHFQSFSLRAMLL